MVSVLLALAILGGGVNLAMGQQCDVAGECLGTFLGFVSANSTPECLVSCKESAGCEWFTHDGPDSFCALYETCDAIDASLCPECVSGQRSCLICGLPGVCKGELLHEDQAGTISMCEVQCQQLSGCNFYSYDHEREHCILFETCTELSDQECQECTTSEAGCLGNDGNDTQPQFLMVFGGTPDYSNNVTLLALDGRAPVPECLKNLNQHPTQLSRSCQATLTNSKLPHVCGGDFYECDNLTCDYGESDECYRYNPDLDTWTVSGRMYESKTRAGCTFSSVPEMVITGGDKTDDTVWYTSDTESIAILPPMPLGLESHCAVALDGNDLFITGGSPSGGGSSSKTFLYRSGTMEWEQLPDMPTSRYSLMCGAIHNAAGAEEVVVAGGGDNVEDVVEIYNVQDGQWRSANPLPEDIKGATVVPLDDTFLLVGGKGYSSYDFLDTIYRYEQFNDSWTLLETRLPSAAQYPVAMMVDIDIFPSC